MDENIWPYQIKRNSRWRRASKIRSCRKTWRKRQLCPAVAFPPASIADAPISSLSLVGVGERRIDSRGRSTRGFQCPWATSRDIERIKPCAAVQRPILCNVRRINAIESGYVNRGIKPRNPSGHQSNYLAPTRCIVHSVSIAVCGVLVACGRLKVRICW